MSENDITMPDSEMGSDHDRPSPLELSPGTVIGVYRLTRKLGQGGMGIVYQATDTTLDRQVAFKLMRSELLENPDFKARFLREAKAAAQIMHPNVVVIHQAGEIRGTLFMAFEFVPGGDLAAKINTGPLTPSEAARIAIACATGLDAIHRAGLIHRDIKPQNIFLDARGNPKLGDLGLARSVTGDDRMTGTGIAMGTPAYMSPEQIEGDADIDIRSDIHALGGVLYAMLTARSPFEGATPYSITHKVMTADRPRLLDENPKMPERLQRVILKAMARDRKDRHQTPKEFIDDLRGRGPASPVVNDLRPVSRTRPTVAQTIAGLGRPSTSSARPWVQWSLVLCGAIAVSVLVSLLFRDGHHTNKTPLPLKETAVAAGPGVAPAGPSPALVTSKKPVSANAPLVQSETEKPPKMEHSAAAGTTESESLRASHVAKTTSSSDATKDQDISKPAQKPVTGTEVNGIPKVHPHERSFDVATIRDQVGVDDAKALRIQKLLEEMHDLRIRVLHDNEGGSPQANFALMSSERERIEGKAAGFLDQQQLQAFKLWLNQLNAKRRREENN